VCVLSRAVIAGLLAHASAAKVARGDRSPGPSPLTVSTGSPCGLAWKLPSLAASRSAGSIGAAPSISIGTSGAPGAAVATPQAQAATRCRRAVRDLLSRRRRSGLTVGHAR